MATKKRVREKKKVWPRQLSYSCFRCGWKFEEIHERNAHQNRGSCADSYLPQLMVVCWFCGGMMQNEYEEAWDFETRLTHIQNHYRAWISALNRVIAGRAVG